MTPALAHTLNTPRHALTAGEIVQIQSLAADLAARYPSAEDPEFLRQVTVFSHELPRSLRATVQAFKLGEPSAGTLIISGYPIDQLKIGRTPSHWLEPAAKTTTREEEMALMLIGSLLGEVFGWATQQAGRLVHEVFPIAGHEHEQLGSGSEELLTWHTEDAFHAARGDYLVLFCLRNPQRASTTVGTLPADRLSRADRALLGELQYTIRPDESHLPKNGPSAGSDARPSEASDGYDRILAMNEHPDPIAVLFGHPDQPYLRLDPYFMDDIEAATPGAAALRALIAAIDADMTDVILDPGDIICLDNFRVVHGRKPFVAAFDGTDRWLKRINVTRDLRKSRHVRATAESRLIGG